ncbi:MAG: ribonuclease Y [Verrucomicrobiae bacterium]|jgi:ribonuclease Y|nr:ribonuclease Y [Verrucomicrobiae bacterium]
MTIFAQSEIWFLLLVAGGTGLGYCLARLKDRGARADLDVRIRDRLKNAEAEAQNILREARLSADEEGLKLRRETEESFTVRRNELEQAERQRGEREAMLNSQMEGMVERERSLAGQQSRLLQKETELQERKQQLKELIAERREQLAKIAQLSQDEARTQLLQEVETAARKDANDLSRHLMEEAKTKTEQAAKRILAIAVQRYASEYTFETTTATISLSGDEIKGRIIGREGRNIRAFEAATGVTVLIDDTPGAVVLSGFDPVRREIAREAMSRLIADGRIHPTRIEEVVEKVTEEIDETIAKTGEEAVFQAGVPPLNEEITRQLGRLKFRQSFSQNVLAHSVEVAHLCGLMAAEMGLDAAVAKRTGLLHDIGKTLNHELEGSHALIGADFLKRHGESDAVVNGVASHHDEVEHVGLFGILVSAADAISAARPGARSETMSTYLKRLENLEEIGAAFEGVDKCYAIQAGRELRVMVSPDAIDDEEAAALARKICRRIEDQLQYPGQIRVTVVRERRVVEFAK